MCVLGGSPLNRGMSVAFADAENALSLSLSLPDTGSSYIYPGAQGCLPLSKVLIYRLHYTAGLQPRRGRHSELHAASQWKGPLHLINMNMKTAS